MRIRIPPNKVSEIRRILELVEASPTPMGLILDNEGNKHFERVYDMKDHSKDFKRLYEVKG